MNAFPFIAMARVLIIIRNNIGKCFERDTQNTQRHTQVWMLRITCNYTWVYRMFSMLYIWLYIGWNHYFRNFIVFHLGKPDAKMKRFRCGNLVEIYSWMTKRCCYIKQKQVSIKCTDDLFVTNATLWRIFFGINISFFLFIFFITFTIHRLVDWLNAVYSN